MNWTGGKLHNHSKSNSNHIIKAQRKHFARARVQSQSGPSLRNPLDHSLFQISDVLTQPTNFELDKSSSQLGIDSTRPAPKFPKPCSPTAQTNLTPIEITKRELLNRTDWLGISAAKPLQMSFSHWKEMQRLGRHRKVHVADSPIITHHFTTENQSLSGSEMTMYSTESTGHGTRRTKGSSTTHKPASQPTKITCSPAGSFNSPPSCFHPDVSSGSLLIEKFEGLVNQQKSIQVNHCSESDSVGEALEEESVPLQQSPLHDISSHRSSATAKRRPSRDLIRAISNTTDVSQSSNSFQSDENAEGQMMPTLARQGRKPGSNSTPILCTTLPKHLRPVSALEEHRPELVDDLKPSPNGGTREELQTNGDVLASGHYCLVPVVEPSHTKASQSNHCETIAGRHDTSEIYGPKFEGFHRHQTPATASNFSTSEPSPLGLIATPIKNGASRYEFGTIYCHDNKTRKWKSDSPSSTSEFSSLSVQRKAPRTRYVSRASTKEKDHEAWIKHALADDFERVQMNFEFQDTPTKGQKILSSNSNPIKVSDATMSTNYRPPGAIVLTARSEVRTSVSRVFSGNCSTDLAQDEFRPGLRNLRPHNGTEDNSSNSTMYNTTNRNQHSITGCLTFPKMAKQHHATSPQRHLALGSQRKRKIPQVLSNLGDAHDTTISYPRKPFPLSEEYTILETPRKRQRVTLGKAGSQSLDTQETISITSPPVGLPVVWASLSPRIPNTITSVFPGVSNLAEWSRDASPYFARLTPALPPLPGRSKREATPLARRTFLQHDLRSSASSFEGALTSSLRKSFDSRPEVLGPVW